MDETSCPAFLKVRVDWGRVKKDCEDNTHRHPLDTALSMTSEHILKSYYIFLFTLSYLCKRSCFLNKFKLDAGCGGRGFCAFEAAVVHSTVLCITSVRID